MEFWCSDKNVVRALTWNSNPIADGLIKSNKPLWIACALNQSESTSHMWEAPWGFDKLYCASFHRLNYRVYSGCTQARYCRLSSTLAFVWLRAIHESKKLSKTLVDWLYNDSRLFKAYWYFHEEITWLTSQRVFYRSYSNYIYLYLYSWDYISLHSWNY